MFSQLCICLQDFIKIVRLILAAVSINGLYMFLKRMELELLNQVITSSFLFQNPLNLELPLTLQKGGKRLTVFCYGTLDTHSGIMS